MKPLHWPKLNKNTWVMSGLISLMLLVWLAVIVPGIGRLQRTVQSIVDAQTTQFSSTQATANLIFALQHRNQLENNVATLEQVFVDRTNPIVFISRFEELAAEHSITLHLSVQPPAEATPNQPVVSTPVTIEASGTWEHVLAFLNAVYTEPITLTTTHLTIHTPSDYPDVVSVSLDAISYWR